MRSERGEEEYWLIDTHVKNVDEVEPNTKHTTRKVRLTALPTAPRNYSNLFLCIHMKERTSRVVLHLGDSI